MKIWLVEHPISKYAEDVKALARTNKLKIVDVKFKDYYDEDQIADNPPSLTAKSGAGDAVITSLLAFFAGSELTKKPNVEACAEAIGKKPTAAERDQAWAMFKGG